MQSKVYFHIDGAALNNANRKATLLTPYVTSGNVKLMCIALQNKSKYKRNRTHTKKNNTCS